MDAKSLIYQFDDVRVDLEKFEVSKGDSRARLEPKAFEALVFLIENRGRLVEKKELLDAVWKDAFVTENAMTRVIAQLRKALGDDSKEAKYIETVPTRGYRFIADVKAMERDEMVEPKALVPNRTAYLPVPMSRRAAILAASVMLVASIIVFFYFRLSNKPSTSSNGTPIRSIAVLPFKPLVADNRDDSLEMGMAETLITKLSSIEQLFIRPMSAVRKYSGPDQDPLAAGREQRADLVLEGSFQKSGDSIRVTARLWNVADGKMLWSDKRDQRYSDIFTVQDSIAEQVTKALTLRLASEVKKRLIKHYTENTEAYYLFVKGSFHLEKRTAEDARKAVNYFEEAVARDPSYALAYASLSGAYAYLGTPGISVLPPKETIVNARQAALTALKLDDTLAEAHMSLASTKIQDWDWQGAEEELKRAIELDPRNPLAHREYGMYLSKVGLQDDSIAELKQASELDPLNVGHNSDIGVRLHMARRDDLAIEQFQRVLELIPNNAAALLGMNWAYEQKGRYQEAIAGLLVQAPRFGDNPLFLSQLGRAYAGAGRKSEAQKIIATLVERAKRGYVSPYLLAVIYARLGDKDQTMIWLEKGYDSRDTWMVWIKVDPVFDVVRSDPRFTDLLRRVGFAS